MSTATPARAVTLTAAQVRAVAVGLVGDRERREIAARALTDALLAEPAVALPAVALPEPEQAPEPDPVEGYVARAAVVELRGALGELRSGVRAIAGVPPWLDDVDDADLLRHLRTRTATTAGGRDIEQDRRLAALVDAVDTLDRRHWRTFDGDRVPVLGAEARDVARALDAVRELPQAPGDIVAPEPAQPAGPSLRDALHDLAPLPWRQGDERDDVVDAEGRRLLRVDGSELSIAEDGRVAELLVRVVNGPEVVLADAATDEREVAERDVIDAARAHVTTGKAMGLPAAGPTIRRLIAALGALDRATPTPGGGVA